MAEIVRTVLHGLPSERIVRCLAAIARCNANVEGMVAANKIREGVGATLAYDERNFGILSDELQSEVDKLLGTPEDEKELFVVDSMTEIDLADELDKSIDPPDLGTIETPPRERTSMEKPGGPEHGRSFPSPPCDESEMAKLISLLLKTKDYIALEGPSCTYEIKSIVSSLEGPILIKVGLPEKADLGEAPPW